MGELVLKINNIGRLTYGKKQEKKQEKKKEKK